MRFHIIHETRYTYNVPVHGMVMESRLRPCNDDFQFCQRYNLQITPKTAVQEYITFNDLPVHYWSLLKATDITILSESIVDTFERPLTAIQAPPIEVNPVDLFPYLQSTPLTAITPNLQAFADQFVGVAKEDWYQTALAVREAIYKALDFQVGFTNTGTSADEVLRRERGVCQDFTHLMIACLRILGIPARYVSGYLNSETSQKPMNAGGIAYQSMSQNFNQSMSQDMTQDLEVPEMLGNLSVRGTGASHAWCEVYMGPGSGSGSGTGSAVEWCGFDAANNLLIDEHYVRIGAGRDFNDVTPLKGVHKGPAEEKLQVTVQIKSL